MRGREDKMTGSNLGFMIFWIIVVSVLAAAWRHREAPAGRDMSGQAARPPAERPKETLNAARGQTRASPPAGRDIGMPAGRPRDRWGQRRAA